MNKQKIFESIINWESKAGEDFLDYFDGDFNSRSFMFWARGKNYITVEQLNAWEKDLTNKLSDANSGAVVYGENLFYSVVSEEDYTEENYHKAFQILAEFISESWTYKVRLKKFLEENKN